ncbi:hypothetical protein NHX12_008682 [Muraenolepis orangiensis]|uniref:Uncharacterized protein n=1 Tax=Muraenolepis orangiensis TaxID=630683 RepID=A0A9Q0DNJ4_9TELE|nr:hypothetical protein NHX12_008682 [Muraenolepis orangiensis]
MRFASRESLLSLASRSICRRAKRSLSLAADNDPESAELVDSGGLLQKGGIAMDPNVVFNVAPFSPSSPSSSPAGETTMSSIGAGAAPSPGPCFSSARTSSTPISTNPANTALRTSSFLAAFLTATP